MVNLVIPHCTLLRIFTGDIQYWDDTELVNVNYLSMLPHKKIRVGVIGGVHGLNGVVTRGLEAMLPLCQRRYPNRVITNAHRVVEALEWALPAAATVPTVEALLEFFRATPNALIAVGSSDVVTTSFSKELSKTRHHTDVVPLCTECVSLSEGARASSSFCCAQPHH